MTHAELDKKRLEPCMAEVYAKAQCPESQVWPQGYDTWAKHGVWCFQYGDKKPVTLVPMDCYYISENDMRKIVEKWSKGLRGWWYYIPKLNHGEKDYKKHKKELEDFRKFEDGVSNNKSLTYAQRAAKIKKEALAHNFMWRSRDKEYVSFNIYLGASPCNTKEHYDRNVILYNNIKQLFTEKKAVNYYIDYVHTDSFFYTDNDGKILLAEVSTTSYWYDNDNKLHSKDTKGYPVCNLYDVDTREYVSNLWNYKEHVRLMTAETFELTYQKLLPVLKDHFKTTSQDDLLKHVEESKWSEEDIKYCLALYLMHVSYMEAQTKNTDK